MGTGAQGLVRGCCLPPATAAQISAVISAACGIFFAAPSEEDGDRTDVGRYGRDCRDGDCGDTGGLAKLKLSKKSQSAPLIVKEPSTRSAQRSDDGRATSNDGDGGDGGNGDGGDSGGGGGGGGAPRRAF